MSISYSSFVIRDLIKDKILDNSIHELLFEFNSHDNTTFPFPSPLCSRHLLLRDSNFQYKYHLTNLLALEIGKTIYNPIRYTTVNKGITELATSLTKVYSDDDSSETYMVEVLMQNDLNRVNLFFATVAWLTVDEFRWHNHPGFEHIPSDLSYGLVQTYPDLLIPYGLFISNLNRYPNLDLLDSDKISLIESIARDSCQN